MKHPLILAAILTPLLASCSGAEERDGEHDRDGAEHGGAHSSEGEEDGTELPLDAIYDQTRNGVNLIIQFNKNSKAFLGTVENMTDKTLEAVRVEVHLSNGKELGPTPAEDLAAGKQRPIFILAESTDFEHWTAHPEVGRGEHGHESGGEPK